ncbi:serine hydrolase domain-containing protein [Sandaracinus amylolyticus]|uniref:serine hydrolase domain-containing protein n=1 Tax=Sandaracinus amylolyticus TaxID=927083 RepID=UPI001F18FDFA|nr:serine hydrolase domain-containing protein [Sandaracinus amylolyticus]UJR82244.1 Hypothetical protein I5071_43090 [Sandaracinus amylolyticus]
MNDVSSRLDLVLSRAVREQRVVGAIARVVRRGEVIYRRAVGLADREAGRAMTPETPHRLASLTKPVTSVAALALVERGVLALEAPVTRWLPDFRPRFGEATPAITLHQLLTHTSGLGYGFLEAPDGPYHRARVSDGLDQPGLSIDENLRRLAGVPLRASPGTEFHYSLSSDVLGAVIERATGARLPEVIAELVTGPLGLETLGFRALEGLAVPYAEGKPPFVIREDEPVTFFGPFAVSFAPRRALVPSSYASGGAGMTGTIDEFGKLLEALRMAALPSLSRASIETMWSDRIAPIDSPTLGEGYGYGYGASVLRDPVAARSPLSRGAVRWGGAYGHSWFVDRASETSSVLLTNTAFEGMTGRLRDEVEEAVIGG